MTFLTLDQQTKKWLLLFLVCLFSWWLLSGSDTCSAANVPKTYTVTEAELQGLDNRLSKLAQISEAQKKESMRLQEQLTKSEQELNLLKNQLNTSTAQLTQAQNSLANANQLLTEYGQEAKRQRLKIKAQRNTWIAIAGCLLVALIAK